MNSAVAAHARIGPSRPMEDQSRWREHASFMDVLVESGFVVLGGPLDEHRVLLAVEAESEDAVRATLARDPWIGSSNGSRSRPRGANRLDARRP
jgi:hypothetical protein